MLIASFVDEFAPSIAAQLESSLKSVLFEKDPLQTHNTGLQDVKFNQNINTLLSSVREQLTGSAITSLIPIAQEPCDVKNLTGEGLNELKKSIENELRTIPSFIPIVQYPCKVKNSIPVELYSLKMDIETKLRAVVVSRKLFDLFENNYREACIIKRGTPTDCDEKLSKWMKSNDQLVHHLTTLGPTLKEYKVKRIALTNLLIGYIDACKLERKQKEEEEEMKNRDACRVERKQKAEEEMENHRKSTDQNDQQVPVPNRMKRFETILYKLLEVFKFECLRKK